MYKRQLFAAVFIGILGRYILPVDPALATQSGAENVFANLSKLLFHPLLAGIVMAGILAATISSSDSYLLIATSAVAKNLFGGVVKKDATDKQIMRISRIVLIAIAVVVEFVWPDFAFNYLMSIATIAAAINWTMIMITEIHFRRVVAAGDGPAELKGLKGKEALDKIAFKLPFARVMPYIVIAFMALVVACLLYTSPSPRD